MLKSIEPEFDGMFGKYQITLDDQNEVKKYRLSVLICGLSFFLGLSQWIFISPKLAWIWLIPMNISLGLALKWIHIYIQTLHRFLQLFWAIGCIGIGILIYKLGANNILSDISMRPILTIGIGPLFIALTGLGFKEFFCFRRPEAIGLTILIPISLIGHFLNLMNGIIVMILIYLSAIALLILSIRKFGMDASLDIGDKSVFEYLQNQRANKSPDLN